MADTNTTVENGQKVEEKKASRSLSQRLKTALTRKKCVSTRGA